MRKDDDKEGNEKLRLMDRQAPWKKWGPYLSERQWGTVREDYSDDGNAWDYFTHDQARSRAYRWGEDGLAGISDDHQQLCFALALWNGRDPILKERLFGLTNSEGNHGEDVKEYYFYLDSTPTHSYMKYLYKYPQAAYPYDDLVQTNKHRSRTEPEYELIDTGVFDQNRYFDVFVEYAKDSPEDILIQITVANRGPDAAVLHVLPTLWFRNTWSWQNDSLKPLLEQRRWARRVPSDRGISPRSRCSLPLCRRVYKGLFHRKRDESGARVRHAQLGALHQRRDQRLRRFRPRRQGEPRKIRHEGLPPLFTRSARRGKPCGPVIIDDDRAEGMARSGQNLRKGNGGQAGETRTNSMPRSRRHPSAKTLPA